MHIRKHLTIVIAVLLTSLSLGIVISSPARAQSCSGTTCLPEGFGNNAQDLSNNVDIALDGNGLVIVHESTSPDISVGQRLVLMLAHAPDKATLQINDPSESITTFTTSTAPQTQDFSIGIPSANGCYVQVSLDTLIGADTIVQTIATSKILFVPAADSSALNAIACDQ